MNPDISLNTESACRPGRNTMDTESRLNNPPPAWRKFMQYCQNIQFGTLHNVHIQNGVPISIEISTQKIRFPDESEEQNGYRN